MIRVLTTPFFMSSSPPGAEAMYHASADLWKAEGLECDILCAGVSLGSYAETSNEMATEFIISR